MHDCHSSFTGSYEVCKIFYYLLQYLFVLFKCSFIVSGFLFCSLDALFEITIRGDFRSISDRMGWVIVDNIFSFDGELPELSKVAQSCLRCEKVDQHLFYNIRVSQ